MRRLCLMLCILLLAAGTAAAQDETPEATLPGPTAVPETPALMLTVEAAVAEVEARTEEANAAVDMAFNLLGLFEALGIVLTLVGGVAAAFGITRLFQAQNELSEARERFEHEMEASRQRLSDEAAEKQAELDALREELTRSNSNATLALSYLPLGESQYKSGDYMGAIDIYQRALELHPKNPVIQYRLGYVYTQSGKLEDAVYHLRLALEIDPDFAPALAVLGYTYRRMGEKMPPGEDRKAVLNNAERCLLQALKRSPRLVDEEGESWWGSLGGLYRRRDQIDDAIDAYQEAAKIVPTSSYAFSNLALLYMSKGNRDQMIETYRQVATLAHNEVQADVDNYWAYADLLTARLALGDVANLEQTLDKLLTTAPSDSPYALESLTDTLNRLSGVMDEARARQIQQVITRIRDFVQRSHDQQFAPGD